MDYLSDRVLIESYKHAVELGLSEEFLHLMREELRKRNIFLILLKQKEE
ncbi:sporulation histidine kinase inhibitor Sda [Radiobacillus deserti]|uniref:Sporulation histidine kinase inhibitor Sda n=1 Tax=Radiobacillus deserti TaxID=2594883 RepID=A0A516KL31_9BACI|nr:sporulation histidine kinase inhibitor Sda [Radiobacillus deserti]